MAEKPPATVDPEAIQRAQRLWNSFTKAGFWVAAGTIAVLIVLALAFV